MGEIELLEKTRIIAEAALERKAEECLILDVRELTSFADIFVLLSGRSTRQVSGIADHIARALKAAGEPALGIEGQEEGLWVLIDCNDVIVHVFEPETRERYSLERLWHDAPKLDLKMAAISSADALDPEKRAATERS
jgi:ribosome silencing factor RsfS/YbeB/iojap